MQLENSLKDLEEQFSIVMQDLETNPVYRRLELEKRRRIAKKNIAFYTAELERVDEQIKEK